MCGHPQAMFNSPTPLKDYFRCSNLLRPHPTSNSTIYDTFKEYFRVLRLLRPNLTSDPNTLSFKVIFNLVRLPLIFSKEYCFRAVRTFLTFPDPFLYGTVPRSVKTQGNTICFQGQGKVSEFGFGSGKF